MLAVVLVVVAAGLALDLLGVLFAATVILDLVAELLLGFFAFWLAVLLVLEVAFWLLDAFANLLLGTALPSLMIKAELGALVWITLVVLPLGLLGDVLFEFLESGAA